MQHLFARINKISGTVTLDFDDILFSWPSGDANWDWTRELDNPRTRMSAVSVGSQRASPATELMLACMFGVEPFKKPAKHATPDLPFHFVWDETRGYPSAFSRNVDEVPQLTTGRSEGADRSKLPWALEIKGQYYRLERYVEESKTYGILAAQRRCTEDTGDQVWLVIAGLSGPGTAAAARVVANGDLQLPQGEIGKDSAVVWLAVEADVGLSNNLPGDNRVIVGGTENSLRTGHLGSSGKRSGHGDRGRRFSIDTIDYTGGSTPCRPSASRVSRPR